jgi:Fur family ferric uptake transcriptional regulator
VYKTLDTLARIGAVRQVSRSGARGRWDAGLKSHHHLVCIECGSVTDVTDARLDAVKPRAAALASRHGFAASDHVVEIFGRCAACRRVKRRARPGSGRSRERRNSQGGKR